MWNRIAIVAALALGACAGDPAGIVGPEAGRPPVQLSISADPSEPIETCREIRITAVATRVNRPVRGIVVNFVPLSGSVFAGAVATNKDGAAPNYWNVGRIFDANKGLVARALDEDGNRVLDDTLVIERVQKQTALVDGGMFFHIPDPDATAYRYVLFGRVLLLDSCGDPVPGGLVTSEYSGPMTPINPAVVSGPTNGTSSPKEEWGLAVAQYRFAKDAPQLPGTYRIVWRSLDVPSLTVTQTLTIP